MRCETAQGFSGWGGWWVAAVENVRGTGPAHATGVR